MLTRLNEGGGGIPYFSMFIGNHLCTKSKKNRGVQGSLMKSWILVDKSDIWIPKCTEGGGGSPD